MSNNSEISSLVAYADKCLSEAASSDAFYFEARSLVEKAVAEGLIQRPEQGRRRRRSKRTGATNTLSGTLPLEPTRRA